MLACGALALRRRFPLAVFLLTLPATLMLDLVFAPFAALFTLAERSRDRRLLAVCALLFALSSAVPWPLDSLSSHDRAWTFVYFFYTLATAAAPVLLGQLLQARRDLSRQLVEIEESREHERLLHSQAVLARERAQLAREMHDVVSHQVRTGVQGGCPHDPYAQCRHPRRTAPHGHPLAGLGRRHHRTHAPADPRRPAQTRRDERYRDRADRRTPPGHRHTRAADRVPHRAPRHLPLRPHRGRRVRGRPQDSGRLDSPRGGAPDGSHRACWTGTAGTSDSYRSGTLKGRAPLPRSPYEKGAAGSRPRRPSHPTVGTTGLNPRPLDPRLGGR